MTDHDNLEEFSDAANYDMEDTSDTGVAFYADLAREAGGPVFEIACGTADESTRHRVEPQARISRDTQRTALERSPTCKSGQGLALLPYRLSCPLHFPRLPDLGG